VRGGVLDPRGNIIVSYALGLRMVSNNVVEAYALYEVVCIDKERNVSKIVVLGDSMMVVQAINKKIQSKRNVFNGITSRTLSLIEGFVEFKIFQVKRELNALVNQWEKLGTRLDRGIISLNGVRREFPIHSRTPPLFSCGQVVMVCPIDFCAYLLAHMRIYVIGVGIKYDSCIFDLFCGLFSLVMDRSSPVHRRLSIPSWVLTFKSRFQTSTSGHSWGSNRFCSLALRALFLFSKGGACSMSVLFISLSKFLPVYHPLSSSYGNVCLLF